MLKFGEAIFKMKLITPDIQCLDTYFELLKKCPGGYIEFIGKLKKKS